MKVRSCHLQSSIIPKVDVTGKKRKGIIKEIISIGYLLLCALHYDSVFLPLPLKATLHGVSPFLDHLISPFCHCGRRQESLKEPTNKWAGIQYREQEYSEGDGEDVRR